MIGAAYTAGVVGTYAVAAGIGACALSNAGEILTGTNVIRDTVFNGDQEAYDTTQAVLSLAGYSATYIGSTANIAPSKSTNNSYNLNGTKNQDYINKRGWNDEMIKTAINNGPQGSSINMANDELCTVYCHPNMRNQYVVIEDASRSIVQVSDFNNSDWRPDWRIIWDE